MVVKISGLNKRGVNCFHKIFAKFGSRVKSYEKSTNWFFVQLNKISLLRLFIANQPVVFTKQLVVYTIRIWNQVKTIYKSRDRENHTIGLY